jgi:hypothetical protein
VNFFCLSPLPADVFFFTATYSSDWV